MNAYLRTKKTCNNRISLLLLQYGNFCFHLSLNIDLKRLFIGLFIEWNFSSGIAFLFYFTPYAFHELLCKNRFNARIRWKKEWIFYYDSYNHHEWLFCYVHVGRLLRQRLQPKAHGLYLFIQIFIDTNFSRNSQCFPLFICSRQFYNSSFCTTFALFTFALKY